MSPTSVKGRIWTLNENDDDDVFISKVKILAWCFTFDQSVWDILMMIFDF